MTQSLSHRGPDGSGAREFFLGSGGRLGLGHCRLSVIDLSDAGRQPMERGNLKIVFNGEIYNYVELRNELQGEGCNFLSKTDTEVLLAGIEHWGLRSTLDRLIGMFAFAVFDERDETLTLVRDRAGVKPLYYVEQPGLLMFASEVKAFRENPRFDATLSQGSIESFFRFGYIPAEDSIYSHARKLSPGCWIEFDLQRQTAGPTETYWSISEAFNRPKLEIGFQDASEQLENLLHSAFQYRMVSDVPVGVFLSGGYDSSIVAAMLQSGATSRLKTFTIGFEVDSFNEAPHAKRIARKLGTDHTEYICTEREAQELIPLLPEFFDEPFGDSSAIPTMLVSRIARQSVTVALSADAGDELFGGYNKYERCLRLKSLSQRIPWPFRSGAIFQGLRRFPMPRRAGQRTVENMARIYGEGATCCDLMRVGSQIFDDVGLRRLLNFPLERRIGRFGSEISLSINNDDASRMMAVDYQTYLPDDILVKVDRATMSVSLEGREPLLDHRLAEFAAQLPSRFKLTGRERKVLLRDVAYRYLSREVLDRPKKGFSVPFQQWLRAEQRDLLMDHLSVDAIVGGGVLNPSEVSRVLARFLKGDDRLRNQVWLLLVFQMWLRRWGS